MIVPIVLLVVLPTLILLLSALVAPLFLLATVVLSYAATLGLTVAIFRFVFDQDGFHSAMPLIIFIFLVALGVGLQHLPDEPRARGGGAARHARRDAERARGDRAP